MHVTSDRAKFFFDLVLGLYDYLGNNWSFCYLIIMFKSINKQNWTNSFCFRDNQAYIALSKILFESTGIYVNLRELTYIYDNLRKLRNFLK